MKFRLFSVAISSLLRNQTSCIPRTSRKSVGRVQVWPPAVSKVAASQAKVAHTLTDDGVPINHLVYLPACPSEERGARRNNGVKHGTEHVNWSLRANARLRYLSFYKYTNLKSVNLTALRQMMLKDWGALGVTGRVFIAQEGINAQLSVPQDSIRLLHAAVIFSPLGYVNFLPGMDMKDQLTDAGSLPFTSLHVRIRKFIVADGMGEAKEPGVLESKGTKVSPEKFHQMLSQQSRESTQKIDVPVDADNSIQNVIVDCRNYFESEVGKFQDARRLKVDSFRDSWNQLKDIVDENRLDLEKGSKRLMMYCTGGIRCVKAASFCVDSLGLPDASVVRLEGGINAYAEWVKMNPLVEPMFKGKNFTFDSRLSGDDQRVSADVIASCHQCGKPCDTHTNCSNKLCHVLFIQCEDCRAKYSGACSEVCEEVSLLPKEEQQKIAHAISEQVGEASPSVWKDRLVEGQRLRPTIQEVEGTLGLLLKQQLQKIHAAEKPLPSE